MNKDLYYELKCLMDKKGKLEWFLQVLKDKSFNNKISLLGGGVSMSLEDADIEMLIPYYENKIKLLEDKINKFYLSKTID